MQEVKSNHESFKDKIAFTYYKEGNQFFIEMYNGAGYLNCLIDGDDLADAIWQEINK